MTESPTSFIPHETRFKCLVILGQGPSWCAGVDVGEHKPEMVEKQFSAAEENPDVKAIVFQGAGKAFVATPAGSMSFPETGIGIYPGLGGMYRMARRVGKNLGYKAPLALKIANEIMDEQDGKKADPAIEIELNRLTEIFSTADALEGLSSLGRKRPEYKGC